MKITGKLTLSAEHDGEFSPIGTIIKRPSGWRFDPADDWVLSAEQLGTARALLEALELRGYDGM